jgi:IclR family KDG regulon transcriptional repressor
MNYLETRSVKRATEILVHIGREPEGLSLSEASRKVGLSKATTYRILQTLVDSLFVRQDERSTRYFIGDGLLKLARGHGPYEDLVRTARPVMESLRDKTRETVTLVVASGEHRLTLDVALGTHELKAAPEKGGTKPLYAGAAGRVLLAYLPSEQTAGLLNKPRLKAVTRATITSPTTLAREAEYIRKTGLAKSMEEAVLGQFSVAAPIFIKRNTIIAALNLCGPTVRLTPESVEQLGKSVCAAAKKISQRLMSAFSHD